jgi:hypothetical protein
MKMSAVVPIEKIRARMDRIDAMPADIRALIHEYGLTVVQAFVDQGVTKATGIRHLIQQVARGSVEPGTSAGSKGWVQSNRNMVVVPLEPTPAMIEASMATVSGHDVVVDKYEKHRLRLRAAIKAGMSRFA